MVLRFTTWGPVRGDCGHVHLTMISADRCVEKDRTGCRKQDGYSDRRIIRLEAASLEEIRSRIRSYDVTQGPR